MFTARAGTVLDMVEQKSTQHVDPRLDAVAMAMHAPSDHNTDFPGLLAPDEGSSYLCNCREKAALAISGVDDYDYRNLAELLAKDGVGADTLAQSLTCASVYEQMKFLFRCGFAPVEKSSAPGAEFIGLSLSEAWDLAGEKGYHLRIVVKGVPLVLPAEDRINVVLSQIVTNAFFG